MITEVNQVLERQIATAAEIGDGILALETQILPFLSNHGWLWGSREGCLVYVQQNSADIIGALAYLFFRSFDDVLELSVLQITTERLAHTWFVVTNSSYE